MAINFPDSPSLNDIFTDETSGFTYQWDGEVWKSYVDATIGNVTKLDDISASFNGVTQTFPLTVNGVAATADLDAATVLLSLGGVVQNPVQDYIISGTDITFTTPPLNGLTFFASYFEVGISKDFVSSGTVSPTGLSTGGFSWNTNGDLYISGVSTISNTGTASTALYVSGNARIAGILTVGSSSITFDGTNNTITGTGITISNDGIVSGAITATTYAGDGVNLVGAGLGTESSINTTGIITASKFSGDATYITDVGGIIDGVVYSPTVGAVDVALASNIEITFNKPIQAGVGTITLRTDSASGTIVENYDISSSDRLTISAGTLTIDPTDSLSGLTTYFTVIPAGVLQDTYGISSNTAIDTYSFTSQQLNNELWMWGYNTYGALGQNDLTQYSSPIQVPGTQWNSIAGHYNGTLMTKTDGTLWAWGRNQYGAVGDNTVLHRSSPVQIPGTQWNKIASCSYVNLATKTDGTLWAWGRNRYGEVGNGTAGVGGDNSHYSSPVQVPGTQWNDISGGRIMSGATKTDGTLWVWGDNSYGALGQNDLTQYSSPIQVPGTQWNKIALGYDSTWSTKTDGTLWGWGRNTRSQLGLNETLHHSSPIQVPGTQWDILTNTSRTYTFAVIKTDGTLWTCGYPGAGRLAQNDESEYSSPRQVPGTQWSSISMAYATGMATKTDNTIWMWGANGDGQLGQNDKIEYSSPVQVPGTQWYSIRSTYPESAAIKQT